MENLKPYITAMVPRFCPDLDELFPKQIQADRARAILQYMFKEYHINMLGSPEYAPYLDRNERYCFLVSSRLQEIGRKSYKSILQTLIANKVIQVNSHPTTGVEPYRPGRAKEYRIHPELTHRAKKAGGKSYRREKITHPTIIKVIKGFYDKRYLNKLGSVCKVNPVFKEIMEFTDSLTLDLTSIDADLQSGKLLDPEETLFCIAEAHIKIYNRHISFDILGKRLYHNLCNLPSELRHYLKTPSGEQLGELDIANSHPWVLSSCLMYPEAFIEFAPEFQPLYDTLSKYSKYNDVKRLHYTCCRGEFISNWLFAVGVIKKLGDPFTKEQAAIAKESLFHNIFYGSAYNHFVKGSPEHEERFRTQLIFKSEYPNVLRALIELKRTSAQTLPFIKQTRRSNGKLGNMRSTPSIMLQSMESHLVYNKITPTLQKHGIRSTTIHDSWIMKISDVAKAKLIIEEVCLELGITPPKLRVTELIGTDINIAPEKNKENK